MTFSECFLMSDSVTGHRDYTTITLKVFIRNLRSSLGDI